MPRKPIGERAMTAAERKRLQRQRQREQGVSPAPSRNSVTKQDAEIAELRARIADLEAQPALMPVSDDDEEDPVRMTALGRVQQISYLTDCQRIAFVIDRAEVENPNHEGPLHIVSIHQGRVPAEDENGTPQFYTDRERKPAFDTDESKLPKFMGWNRYEWAASAPDEIVEYFDMTRAVDVWRLEAWYCKDSPRWHPDIIAEYEALWAEHDEQQAAYEAARMAAEQAALEAKPTKRKRVSRG